MNRIRTIIVDDEPLGRKRLRALLKVQPQIEVVAECSNGHEAIAAVDTFMPQLMLLDIQMPEMNGFQVLGHLTMEKIPAVIFVTAYDQYALQAFEAHALDYLLKPFADERFERALARAETFLDGSALSQMRRTLSKLGSQAGVPPPYISRIAIKTVDRIVFVKTDDIDWIEAAGNYVTLHVGKDSFMTRGRIKELEKKLNAQTFLRIHRTTIVNLDRVREMQPLFQGEAVLILRNGQSLKVSRHCGKQVREAMAIPL
jgi:two-component system LytT family response regulator